MKPSALEIGNMLETLEARIAPASFSHGSFVVVGIINVGTPSEGTADSPEDFGAPEIVSGSELRFKDADGDGITIKFDRDVLTPESLANAFHFEEGARGKELVGIDIAKLAGDAKSLKGLDISVTSTAARLELVNGPGLITNPETGEVFTSGNTFPADSLPGGNGMAEIGFINGAGIDLGDVSIAGNLGKIVAGDSKLGTAGLESLTVANLGDPNGTATQGDVTSVITGALGKLDVKNSIFAAILKIQGGKNGDLLDAHIGGDLWGGDSKYSGSILAEGTIKSLAIGGDLIGGSAERTGFIQAHGGIKDLVISGGIYGGSDYGAGRIEAKGLGKVQVAEGLHSGTDDYTGSIYSTKNIKSLELGGLEGGAYRGSGAVFVDKSIGKVAVAGDIDGGAGEASGYIQAQKRIGQLSVDGDLSGANGARSGSIASFDGKIGKISHDGATVSGTGNDSGEILNFVNKKIKNGGPQGTSGASLSFSASNSGMPPDLSVVPGVPFAFVEVPNSITFATGVFFASKIQEVLNGMAMGLVTSASNGSLNIFVYGKDGFLSLDELVADYKFTWRDSFSVVDRAGGGITISYIPASSNG